MLYSRRNSPDERQIEQSRLFVRRASTRKDVRLMRFHAGPRRLLTTLALTGAFGFAAETAGAGDWKFGPGVGFSSKQKDFEFKLAGYVQSDFRGYPNWEAGDEDTGPLRFDNLDLRRGRIGVEGKWKELDYELDVDWTQPGRRILKDGDEPAEGWGGIELKNAAIDYQFNKALRIRAGHFKPPISPEFLTSSSKIDFVERSLLSQNMAPDRDWGAMLYGELLDRIIYQAGVFAGDGRTAESRAETTFAARVQYMAVEDLMLGVYSSIGDVKAPVEPELRPGQLVIPPELIPQPNGFGGRGASGFRFSERRFVEGRRLRLGTEATYWHKSYGLKGEYMYGREQRKRQSAIFTDLPDEVGQGWAVSATWLLTGEKKERTLKPKRPLPGGPGAIEVGVRVEGLRYDDAGDDSGFEGAGNRARNIRPASLKALTGGVSWWPTSFMRVMGNVVVDRYVDPLLAPERDRLGNYVSLQGRVQLHFP
jgi:phosphate-selective porin